MDLLVHYSEDYIAPVHVEAGQVVVCGREPDDCSLVLRGEGVSRCHCKLSIIGPWAWIEDLGSANGTYVNGQRVQSCPFQQGDVIRIGGHQVEVG